MREVDSAAFGKRVRERRLELRMSQKALGKASGLSQQNIGWIESGDVKRPRRNAAELAEALQTTREWLLWGEGQRAAGPRILSPKELVEKYESMPPERKAYISQVFEDDEEVRRKAG